MANCLACGSILFNINNPCPKCGYIFDADTELGCPNKENNICLLTGEQCNLNEFEFGSCEVKNLAELESDY